MQLHRVPDLIIIDPSAAKRLNLPSDQPDKRNIKLSLIYINYRLFEQNNIPIPACIIAIDLHRSYVIIIYRL